MDSDGITRLKWTGDRTSLDTRGSVDVDGNITMGSNADPALSMNPGLTVVNLGLKANVHVGMTKDLRDSLKTVIALANEAASLDPKTAEHLYAAIAEFSRAIESFTRPELVVANKVEDDKRNVSMADYFMDNLRKGKVSRY